MVGIVQHVRGTPEVETIEPIRPLAEAIAHLVAMSLEVLEPVSRREVVVATVVVDADQLKG